MSDNTDRVFAEFSDEVGRFAFDEKVATVFEDMIQRSVPGYEMSLSMIALITRKYAKPGTVGYDLGCSLGASSMAMISGNSVEDFKLVGVDTSEAMLDRCARNLKNADFKGKWDLVCEDIMDTEINNASIVVLNFTLQFVPQDKRLRLLKKIYEGMVPGGVLLLSEKLAFGDPLQEKALDELHLDFKRAHGYSELEISQKRTALDTVLVPETMEAHRARLKQARFGTVCRWFQCFNFASLIAIKD